jgi:MSHA biogenesis protein MshG
MPDFLFTGRSGAQPVSGLLQADDTAAAAAQLQARGIVPLTITAQRLDALSKPVSWARPQWLQGSVSVQELMLFSRQLHVLLRAGVPILRALAGLQEGCGNPRLASTLGEMRRSLESGLELSLCMAQQQPLFSAFYIAMVRVGEMTGRLDEVLKRLSDQLEFDQFMAQQVKSALRYPGFVMLAMAAAIGVINVMVVPAFAQVFASFKAELPLATRILIASSRLTLDWGWLIALVGVAWWALWRQWIHTEAGRRTWDQWVLKFPLAGSIVRKATLARFARSMSLALSSGLPIEQTLTVTAQTVGNEFIAARVEGMREQVERGDTLLRSAITAGVFTPVVLQMIAVGEETGSIDELMDEIAGLYTGDVQYELKTLSQQIEPVLIVIMGALVLLLALGVFLPMWELGNAAFKNG